MKSVDSVLMNRCETKRTPWIPSSSVFTQLIFHSVLPVSSLAETTAESANRSRPDPGNWKHDPLPAEECQLTVAEVLHLTSFTTKTSKPCWTQSEYLVNVRKKKKRLNSSWYCREGFGTAFRKECILQIMPGITRNLKSDKLPC